MAFPRIVRLSSPVVLGVFLFAATAAHAAIPTTAEIIGSGRASGDFAIATASGQASGRNRITVQVIASPRQKVTVNWTMVCSNGSGAGSKSGEFSTRSSVPRAMKRPSSDSHDCTVAATAMLDAGGTLRVRLRG